MDLALSDKVVLVTGGSAGIGLACVESFLKEGCHLFIAARTKGKLEHVLERMKDDYPFSRIAMFAGDLNEESTRQELIERTLSEYQRIDVLINNIEGPPHFDGDLNLLSEDDCKDALEGKLTTYIRMINLVFPSMKQQQSGRIINIVGAVAKEPAQELLMSGVVNAGIINFTKSYSRFAAKYNVLLNSINPGFIQTQRYDAYVKKMSDSHGLDVDEIEKQLCKKIPIGTIGKPEDIANMALFLASQAARYITGVTMNIDGGLSMSAF